MYVVYYGGKENCNDIFGICVILCQECKMGRYVKIGKLFYIVECIEDYIINSDLYEFLMIVFYKIESIINMK